MSRPDLTLVSGAGNRFVLADGFRGPVPEDLAALARQACGADPTLDGLLALVSEPGAVAPARLVIHNADGRRAAACGNGLRCAALRLFEDARRGLLELGTRVGTIETDAGPRAVELLEGDGARGVLRVAMGRAQVFALRAPVRHAGRELEALGVRLGNPHCVLCVADERDAPVAELGDALQRHPDFPGGVNVGFLARRDGAWYLRVRERGVGETQACGSGACAAAAASGALDAGSVEMRLPGGVLHVARDLAGELWLTGEAREHGALSARSTQAAPGQSQPKVPPVKRP